MAQPPFIPKPGQTDFTHIRYAPTINCILEYQGKILLVKRSNELRLYPGYWNGVTGFLDDQLSIDDKVREELREELGLEAARILSIRHGHIFEQDAPELNKTWIVHPIHVVVDTDHVTLDWEASEYRWVTPDEARSMNVLPGFERVLGSLINH